MAGQTLPNTGRRALWLILAVGIVGIVLALLAQADGSFLTFNLTHMIVLAALFVVGGALLLVGAGAGAVSAGTVSNLIILIGIAAIVVGLVLRIGGQSDLLTFDLMQIVYLGVLFTIVGFLVRSWLSGSGNWPRRVAWLILIVGVVVALLALAFQLIPIAPDFLTFSLLQLFALGVLFAIVGVLLLIFLRAEAPAPTPMAQPRAAAMSAPATPKAAPPPAPAPEVRAAASAPEKRDDLTIIEGIGPKSAEALYQARIFTFRQVAEMSPETLTRIVRDEGGVRLVNDASTWPRQARLLAEGRMQEFEELVKQLVGSRDVKNNKGE